MASKKSWIWLILTGCLLLAGAAAAVTPRPGAGDLEQRAFFRPELYLSVSNLPLAELQPLLANAAAWNDFLAHHGGEVEVYVDPRSGVPTNVLAAIPFLPGSGVDNQLTLDDLGERLGKPVAAVDAALVGELFQRFVLEHRSLLGVDPAQLGPVVATRVSDVLWQIHAPQEVDGVPVRHSRLAATVSHGNLVLLGGEVWGEVRISTRPRLGAEAALERGFAYVGGRQASDRLLAAPRLELQPFAPPEHSGDDLFTGAPGEGYGHYLAWVFTFERAGEIGRWELRVDAVSGEVLALEDLNQYADRHIVGGIYPHTNTEICPLGPYSLVEQHRCGLMQTSTGAHPIFRAVPMPWADTGLPNPNSFTDGAGVYNWTSPQVTTSTLNGSFVRIVDACGPISQTSATGFLDFLGSNGQHNCTVPPGASLGNTAAARTVMSGHNKIAQVARGWLPANLWLQSKLTANVDVNSSCGAFWNGTATNFFRGASGCGNTGEILSIIDHEWGHGLDDNDAVGALSNPSEAYADVAAIYRGQSSCIAYGFFDTVNLGCGTTTDGTGFNGKDGPHCLVDCSGPRNADWAKHANNAPDTPQNLVCPLCMTGTGPCGRQIHCASTPIIQAAWDLAARDLRGSPFFLDENQAFIVANRLFYQGSGNVGAWYACTCGTSTSNGCGATNGYMQWLATDDDNGNLGDGTPHMTAIHAAFNRHNIACATPAPTKGGCAGGPTAAPATVQLLPGASKVDLTWSAVANASAYWVMRSEGVFGCATAKTRIATVAGTSYTDNEVLPGYPYCYTIVPIGTSQACMGRASVCTCTTPFTCPTPGAPTTRFRETFAAGIPATWTVTNGGSGGGASATWTTANPCGLAPGLPFVSPWAEVNSACAGLAASQDEQLITPEIDVSTCHQVELSFANQFAWSAAGQAEVADVDVSVSSTPNTWWNVLRLENRSVGHPTPETRVLDLTPHTTGSAKLRVRFHYYKASGDGFWAVDSVNIRCLCPK